MSIILKVAGMIQTIALSGNEYTFKTDSRYDNLPWNDFFGKKYGEIQWIKKDKRIKAGYWIPKDLDFPFPLFIKWVKTRNRIEKGARLLIGSRSRRSFKNCLHFEQAGLPVPKSLGFLENKSRGESALLTQFFPESVNLGSLFIKHPVEEELCSEIAKTLAAWHQKGAYHGDLKWSNLLITQDQKCIIIDLDQSRLYSRPTLKRISKDLVRFYRFGLEVKAEGWVRGTFMKKYAENLMPLVFSEDSLLSVSNRARREWKMKGCRTFQ